MCVCVCRMACKQNYISDQHKTAIGAACFHWPEISLNLIHTRRERMRGGGDTTFSHKHTHTHISVTQTHAHPSRGQPPITLLCQLPQLSMINPFSMGSQEDCTDKGKQSSTATDLTYLQDCFTHVHSDTHRQRRTGLRLPFGCARGLVGISSAQFSDIINKPNI